MEIQHNLPKVLMHQKSSKVQDLHQQQGLGMDKVVLSQNKELHIQGMLHIRAAKTAKQHIRNICHPRHGLIKKENMNPSTLDIE